jgi:hypothetical protein
LQYVIQELQQEGEEVIIFLDANHDDQQTYQPQEHNERFKTRNGFHVDGSIDGSLGNFMANCGFTNALTDLHAEQAPNTHVKGSKQKDFSLVSDGIWP